MNTPSARPPLLGPFRENAPYDLSNTPRLPEVLRRLADLEPARFALSRWHDDPDEADTPAYLFIRDLQERP